MSMRPGSHRGCDLRPNPDDALPHKTRRCAYAAERHAGAGMKGPCLVVRSVCRSRTQSTAANRSQRPSPADERCQERPRPQSQMTLHVFTDYCLPVKKAVPTRQHTTQKGKSSLGTLAGARDNQVHGPSPANGQPGPPLGKIPLSPRPRLTWT